MNENLKLSIQASVDGKEKVDGLANSIDRVPASSDRAGKSLLAAGLIARTVSTDFMAAGDSTLRHASSLMRATEAAAAFVGSHLLANRALAEYSLRAGAGASATNLLVDGYRSLRLLLSPTIFTATSLGVGILTEKTLELVSARGKLIAQEALLSARSGVSFANVDRLNTISGISGANASDLTRAMEALKSRAGTDKYKSALDTLSVPKYFQDASSPQILAEIARGFANIPDPVKRAEAAVSLFGGELAEKVLPQLNQKFADSARAADEWGLGLSEVGRNQIFRLSRDMSALKDNILSLGSSFEAAGGRIAQSLELGAAKSYDFLQNLRTLTEFQRKNAADTASNAPTSDAERSRILEFSNRKFGANTSDLLSKNSSGLLEGGVLSAIAEAARTRAGVEAELSRQRASQATAEAAINKGGLSSDEQRDAYAQYQAATQGIARSTTTLNGFDTSRRQQEALLRSRELVNKSILDPTAGRDLKGEIQKDTTFVDSDGVLQHYKLLDETRRNLSAAFSAFTMDLNKKASEGQIKDEENIFQLGLKFDQERWQKRSAYITETAVLELSTLNRSADHANVILGYGRDQQLRDADLLGLNPPQTLRGRGQDQEDYESQRSILEAKSGLDQVQRKQGILERFITASSVNDNAALERSQQAALIGVETALKAGNITPEDADKRSKAIYGSGGQAGTELNSRFAADLLKAQQEGVIDTARILQGLSDKNVERLQAFSDRQTEQVRSLSGSIFDAATSHTPGAIPNFLRSQAMDFGKTITENAAGHYIQPLLASLPKSDSFLWKGTMLEAGPHGGKDLLAAGTSLQTAAADLTAAAHTLSGGSGSGGTSSGGGGGGLPSSLGAGGVFSGSGNSPFVFNSQPGALDSEGLPIYQGPDLAGSSKIANMPSSGFGLNSSTLAKAAAAGAGAFAAFSDFRTGGAKNDIAGVGAGLGSAAAIAAMFGPAGAPAALGLGIAALATSLVSAVLPDPHVLRQNAINKELSDNQFIPNQALNVTQSSGGTFADFDAHGILRTSDLSPFPQERQGFTWAQSHGLLGGPDSYYQVPGGQLSQYGATQPAAPPVVQHIYNIQTMDAASFNDFAQRNHMAIGNAAAKNIQADHGSLSTELDRRIGR